MKIQILHTKVFGTRWVGAYGGVKDQSPWVRLRPEAKCFRWMVLEFNPVVTFASLLLILGFVTWAMVSPEQAGQEFTHWKSWVGLNFTWLYIGAQVRNRLISDCLLCGSYKCVLAGRVGAVCCLPLLQQVWGHPARPGGLPTGIQ